MRALVVYESMYGNTHTVADAIGRGLTAAGAEALVVPVRAATPDRIAEAELLVVGGPTHAHGLSRPTTRRSAVDDAAKPGRSLAVEPDAGGDGLREWFDALPELGAMPVAAFDTRVHLAPALTGRASKGISKRLRRHGGTEVVPPESFLVDKANALDPGEAERAAAWAGTVQQAVAGTSVRSGPG